MRTTLQPHSATSSASHACTRRSVLQTVITTSVAALGWAGTPSPASAGLLLFPASSLNNQYFLVRAGESDEAGRNVTLTNPVWKTALRSGLSDTGKVQVARQAIPALQSLGACEDSCWIWPSITQNCYQTAEIIAYQFDIGRNRIVPEYSFLDARGVGSYEGLPIPEMEALIARGDLQDTMWKPPKGTDGTPNESVEEVLARVRQLLSITETQYRGEDVLLVAPDSDTLSVLQAAVLGRDLTQHRVFAMRPGEVRALQLSTVSFDDSPRTVSCPNPPFCRPAK